MTKKLLGYVGVDSGQLMICDPCYIDSEWEKKEYQDIRLYLHKKTAQIYQYNSPFTKIKKNKAIELFLSYDQKMKNGKTINEMLINKEIKELPPTKEKKTLIGDFSYAGICETTQNDKNQINYRAGHEGAAVAFCSGYGDGTYPIYGHFNKEGRCMKVEILMN